MPLITKLLSISIKAERLIPILQNQATDTNPEAQVKSQYASVKVFDKLQRRDK
jgi:hypothetical protein